MEISSNQEVSETYHLGGRKNKTRTPFSVNSEATSLAMLCVEARDGNTPATPEPTQTRAEKLLSDYADSIWVFQTF